MEVKGLLLRASRRPSPQGVIAAVHRARAGCQDERTIGDTGRLLAQLLLCLVGLSAAGQKESAWSLSRAARLSRPRRVWPPTAADSTRFPSNCYSLSPPLFLLPHHQHPVAAVDTNEVSRFFPSIAFDTGNYCLRPGRARCRANAVLFLSLIGWMSRAWPAVVPSRTSS